MLIKIQSYEALLCVDWKVITDILVGRAASIFTV